jgi:hypothetical protein
MRKINRKVKVISFSKLEDLQDVKAKIIENLKQKFDDSIEKVTSKKDELSVVLKDLVEKMIHNDHKLSEELQPINFYLNPRASIIKVLDYISQNDYDITIENRAKFHSDLEEYKENFEYAFNIIKRLKESGLETSDMNRRLMDIFFKTLN